MPFVQPFGRLASQSFSFIKSGMRGVAAAAVDITGKE